MAEYLVSRVEHDLMLNHYRKQEWDEALNLLDQLHGEFDSEMDKYYHMMIERIGELREQDLPSDWDTVYRTNSK